MASVSKVLTTSFRVHFEKTLRQRMRGCGDWVVNYVALYLARVFVRFGPIATVRVLQSTIAVRFPGHTENHFLRLAIAVDICWVVNKKVLALDPACIIHAQFNCFIYT